MIVGGAELFTGNNLVAMAGPPTVLPALRSAVTGCWCMRATQSVALGTVVLVLLGQVAQFGDGQYARLRWPSGGTRRRWGW